jgi:hypothetical protein
VQHFGVAFMGTTPFIYAKSTEKATYFYLMSALRGKELARTRKPGHKM